MIDLSVHITLCNHHILLFTCRRNARTFRTETYSPVLVIKQ